MKNKYNILHDLEIIDIADEGMSVARYEGMVVFVSGAVPGDVVDVKVTRTKRDFMEAKAIEIKTYSPDRTTPFCKHFGTCGGCKWQYLAYEKQLFYKHKHVNDCLQRIAKIETEGILFSILASATQQYYRNKLEYTFSSYRWLTDEDMAAEASGRDMNALGFHIPGKFDKVLDIESCYLQAEPSNSIRLAIKKYAKGRGLPFFDLRKQTGYLRNIIIRTSTTGEVMLIVIFAQDEAEKRMALLDHIAEKFPSITSLMYVINTKRNAVITDLEIIPYKGNSFIMEQMDDLRFKIGPISFFQTNPVQAHALYKVVRDYAALKGDETVYDLYTGTGTIANFVASSAKKVVGIEFVEAAVKDAYENSAINNITNCSFFAGDIAKILNPEFINANGVPEVVITDPPRSGMHRDVVNSLLQMAPQRIVYVSCNPSTQARDISLMLEQYRLEKSQPVDMFPQTQHVENVALLVRK